VAFDSLPSQGSIRPRKSAAKTSADGATEGGSPSLAARYVRMLIDRAATQENPEPALLNRIEKFVDRVDAGATKDTGFASPLKTSYVDMLIDRAGSQVDIDAKLLDRIERFLAEKWGPVPRGVASRRRVAAPAPAARPARTGQGNGRRRSAGAGHPEVPADHYAGLGVTAAYRKFVGEFGAATYSVPQIRDALLQGGVRTTSPGNVLTGLHSVRRRDRLAAEKAAGAEQDGQPF